MTPAQIIKDHTRFTQCREELGRLEEQIKQAIVDAVWSGEQKRKAMDANWNAAVSACQERVYSDGMELHPELVAELEKLKR